MRLLMRHVNTLLILLLYYLHGLAQADAVFSHDFKTSPLAIVQVDFRVKLSSLHTRAASRLTFYDSSGNQLLKYKGESFSDTAYKTGGFYTEAPPFASYATVSIGLDSGGPGKIVVDEFRVQLEDETKYGKHPPEIREDEYMKPFWASDTIWNETVLLFSSNGNPATGDLLFKPDKILVVGSFDGKEMFTPGIDFIISGNRIIRLTHTKMPFRTDTSFDKKNDLAWYNLQSQWITVTYTHHDAWTGLKPSFKGRLLPGTLRKLRAGSPLNIVAYGMSITRGLDVSGYDTAPPYMPTYLQLFANALARAYGNKQIRMYNAGLPGALVSWGADYASDYINPLRPDLVIIDFGMNDFWRYDPPAFKKYVETIMQKVRAVHPDAEFLLLSNLKFDPEYVLDTDKNKAFYLGNMIGYASVLRGLEQVGVANLDMTTISDLIYKKKKPRDCLANPLHPNDYMARWYAQGLFALLHP